MTYFRMITLCAASLSLSACLSLKQQTPFTPENLQCGFEAYALRSEQPDYQEKTLAALEDNQRPMLYLSGGSLNGAFGAGYLNGWARKPGGLPNFSVVTGVSTGAILSLAAFAGVPEAAVDGYRIDGEHDVLSLYVTPDNGKLGISDYIAALDNGALADLGPMRNSTRAILLDPRYDLLTKIAAKGARGDKLYTGVVDLDTGEAMALDMTKMALKIVAEPQGSAKRERYTNCFVEAIAASSSVPMAAKPTAIDNRLYIDGGARFLTFSDQVGPLVMGVTGEPFMSRDVYLIINGDQTLDPICAKKDEALCSDPPRSDDRAGARKDWTLPSVLLRSIDILTSQVKMASAEKILRDSDIQGYDLKAVKIEADVAQATYTENGETLTCPEWKARDKATDNSLQFHKTYMKCVMAYGEAKALRDFRPAR